MFPLFVTVTCTDLPSPKYADAAAGAPKTAAYVTGATNDGSRSGVLPRNWNQATPSRTRSKLRMHAQAAGGATTVAFTVTEPFGSTFAESGERSPSQTTVFPVTSCQW